MGNARFPSRQREASEVVPCACLWARCASLMRISIRSDECGSSGYSSPSTRACSSSRQTRAIDEAEDWLKLVPGLEGVVAKRCDRPYLAGERQWIKVKKQRTADCAVIGVAGDRSRPSLVLGLRHADGLFHHFGVARSSSQMLTEVLSTVLAQSGPDQSPIPSRWQHAAVPAWCPVPPTIVCEVSYTTLDSADGSGSRRGSYAGGRIALPAIAGSSNWTRPKTT